MSPSLVVEEAHAGILEADSESHTVILGKARHAKLRTGGVANLTDSGSESRLGAVDPLAAVR